MACSYFRWPVSSRKRAQNRNAFDLFDGRFQLQLPHFQLDSIGGMVIKFLNICSQVSTSLGPRDHVAQASDIVTVASDTVSLLLWNIRMV
jgi:hypothetical protein